MVDTKKAVKNDSDQVLLTPDQSEQVPTPTAPDQPAKKTYALDYAPMGEKNLIGGRYIVEGRLVDAEGNPVNEGK